MEMSCRIQVAENALFGQFESDSVFERAMEVDSSCFSLGLMIRKCLTSLLQLGLQENESCYVLWQVSYTLSNKCQLGVSSLYRPPFYAAPISLDQCN